MRSIAIINQKGGVGKTTTAVNLSAALAELGQRVCLIDLDPQAHASLHLGVTSQNSNVSIYDVLVGDALLADVRRPINANLWLVPSHIDLAAAEVELAGEVGREMILRDKLHCHASPSTTEGFDFVIIDCPPSLGVLTLNALVAVGEVFLPLQPHFLALHGLSKLLETIEVVIRRLNRSLRLTGVVFCMYESATRSRRKSPATWPTSWQPSIPPSVLGTVPRYFRRGFGTTFVWRRPPVLVRQFSNTLRIPTALSTIGTWPRMS